MASSADFSKVGRGVPAEPQLAVEGSAPQAATTSGRSLWLWVGGAFLMLFCLWAALFLAARSAHIETVPLQTEGVRK